MRQRVGLWLAAFALLCQSVAFAAPAMAGPADAHAAAAELSELLGPGVVVCAQADPSRAPAKAPPCCDQCPLCQFASHAAALPAPPWPPLAKPARGVEGALALLPSPPPPAPRALAFALARGPPALT